MAKKSTNKLKVVKTAAKVNANPVGYKGEVTLKLQKDGYDIKTIKTYNSATMKMLHGLASFLCGEFDTSNHYETLDAKQYVPEYLAIGYQPAPQATNPVMQRLYNEYKISRIKLDKGAPRLDSTGKRYMCPITAVINYAAIGSRRITELGLFATVTGDTMLARVNIESDANGEPGIELAVGMNLLVEWNIVLQNT